MLQLDPNLRSADARNFEEGLRRKNYRSRRSGTGAVVDLYQVFSRRSELAGRPLGNLLVSGADGGGETRMVEAKPMLYGDRGR